MSNFREAHEEHSRGTEKWIKTSSQKLPTTVLLPKFKAYVVSALPGFQIITKQDTAGENVIQKYCI